MRSTRATMRAVPESPGIGRRKLVCNCTQTGGFEPITTVQLQASFLRPIPGDSGAVRVVTRVLRMDRKLVFGEIEILDASGELAAHATTTYAWV